MRPSQARNEDQYFGLWPSRLVRNENAITFSGGIVVGVLLAVVGVAIALNTCQAIGEERSQLVETTSHVSAWLMALGSMLIGIFLANAGVIYWWRRLFMAKRMR
jgi:hypothetical protein